MPYSEHTAIKAWECQGCGRIEAPQPCIGVCQDRAVEFVRSEEYEVLIERYSKLVEHNARMRELLVRLAGTHPRDGRWEKGYRALQARSAELLKDMQTPDQDRTINPS